MDLVGVLNTIRDNASDIYRQRIPEATRTNIQDIQEGMTNPNNAVVTNEFISTLLNMIIKQVIHNKFFSDPLKSLKKGTKPLQYRSKPMCEEIKDMKTEKEKEQDVRNARLKAQIFFDNWARKTAKHFNNQ